MTVRQYHNTDISSPVVGGVVGSMIGLLDAVLVNGYGSMPPLGWTKEYSGTNIAVYRNNTSVPGSTGMYLRVDDTNASYALARVYKTMTDLNTGTDRAPSTIGTTVYQNDIFWYKHYNGTISPKRWVIIGDERTFYMNINVNNAYPTDTMDYCTLAGAGDFDSFVPSNSWNYMVFGHGNASVTGSTTFPEAGSSTQHTAYIGRSGDLVVDKCSRIFTQCPQYYIPGNASSQFSVSPYTGLRHYADPIIVEDRVQSFATGKLRGCVYHVGRGSDDWFTNYGKLPDDPTGPDLRQLTKRTSTVLGTLLVKESDW